MYSNISRGCRLIFLGTDDRFTATSVLKKTLSLRDIWNMYDLMVGGVYCILW